MIDQTRMFAKPMTFNDHLKRMTANYQVKSFPEALDFWEAPQQPSSRTLNYEETPHGIQISEKGRILDIINISDINGMSVERYVDQVSQLLSKGASVPEAILLGALV